MIKKVIWTISFLITILFLFATIYIIHETHFNYKIYQEKIDTNQKIETSINNFIKQYHSNIQKINFVPTGLYVDSLKFVSAYSVHISGYLWQIYDETFPKNFLKGVIFPGATNVKMDQVYEAKLGRKTSLAWHFDGDFTQSFDYSKYPLDYKTVSLRLWPKDFDPSIILMPDLKSYDMQLRTFGLDPRIILQGYTVSETYFSYNLTHYDTNFGLNYQINVPFLEVYFNVSLKRNILSAFMINLLPLLIVLILSFGVLHIMTSEEEVSQKYGFKLANIDNVCAAMLFVVVLLHIRLRETITYDNIIYIEIMYFAIYFGLIYITFLGFLVMNVKKKHGWLNFLFYDDCLLPKALYLPGVFGFILWGTVNFLK